MFGRDAADRPEVERAAASKPEPWLTSASMASMRSSWTTKGHARSHRPCARRSRRAQRRRHPNVIEIPDDDIDVLLADIAMPGETDTPYSEGFVWRKPAGVDPAAAVTAQRDDERTRRLRRITAHGLPVGSGSCDVNHLAHDRRVSRRSP
jgi:hypothetical protein